MRTEHVTRGSRTYRETEMPEDTTINRSELLALASEIVSAHVSNNRVAQSET